MTPAPEISRRTVVVGTAGLAVLAACDSVRARSAQPAPPGSGTSTTAEPLGTVPPVASSAAGGPPDLTAATTASGPARFVRRREGRSTGVALTFHASGDRVLATRLLDLLQQRRALVTVFGVGQWLAANPQLAARIVNDGHELANHTLTHQAMGKLTTARISEEITGCADVLRRLTGSIGKWFRPSGIEVPTTAILDAAGAAGYGVSVGYDVDSLDFPDPGGAAVFSNVVRAVRGGSIVSLHFGHQGTIDALPSVLDQLHAAGLQPVTVSQLLA
jgi:peptidoglycan/xylan/chitin deacetylase (PgdA/CDA1 family)